MKNIFKDLFYGRISGWERRPNYTAEDKAIYSKIEDERRYFISKMSLDDVERFQAFENLYIQSNEINEIDIFQYGFRLGTMLMCGVFMDENVLSHD